MTKEKNYFSFRYSKFLVSQRCSGEDAHQVAAEVGEGYGGRKNLPGKGSNWIYIITMNEVTASREDCGTIPMGRGEENSRRHNHRGKRRIEKKKCLRNNRAILKGGT